MGKHIYTDYETEGVLIKLKNLDSDFNLSDFLKQKLKEHIGILAEKNQDIEFLQEKVSKLKKEFNEKKEQLNHFSKILREVKKEKREIEKKQEIKQRTELEKEIAKEKRFASSIKDFFNVKDAKTINKLAKEFSKVYSEKDLFEFMKEKGYEEKEVKK